MLVMLLIVWYEIPVTEHITLKSDKISEPFRIALVTDLHSCSYGKNEAALVKMVEKNEPDVVLMAGDIFDDKLKDDNSKAFISSVSGRYKCFYVTGNHEFWSGRVDEMKEWLTGNGIAVLDGKCLTDEINGNTVDFCGVDDPTDMTDSEWARQLNRAYEESSPDHYRILLSHRPERHDKYENYYFDLVVTGHAHGGQCRIPFTNIGILAPDQYLFPKYISGLYELDNGVNMVVSRGLARESTPAPRFFNHPELVIIDVE
jgi:predicted MPP superfamily phosphohydrolase